MDPVSILSITAVTAMISVGFTVIVQYFPKVNVAWGGLPKEHKKFIVLAGYLVVGAAVAWGGCIAAVKNLIPQLLCAQPASFAEYALGVFFAVGGGQSVFGLAPEAAAVTEVIAERDAAVLAETK